MSVIPARWSWVWCRLGLDQLTAGYREFGDPIPADLIPHEEEKNR
jgi:hypothetical protein